MNYFNKCTYTVNADMLRFAKPETLKKYPSITDSRATLFLTPANLLFLQNIYNSGKLPLHNVVSLPDKSLNSVCLRHQSRKHRECITTQPSAVSLSSEEIRFKFLMEGKDDATLVLSKEQLFQWTELTPTYGNVRILINKIGRAHV